MENYLLVKGLWRKVTTVKELLQEVFRSTRSLTLLMWQRRVIWDIPTKNMFLHQPIPLATSKKVKVFFIQSGSVNPTESGVLFGINFCFYNDVKASRWHLPPNSVH